MALPAALVHRFPRLSAATADRSNGDYGLVLSSFKQLERALRCELGATGRNMPQVFASVQTLLPAVVLSHLRYLNYERNQLAHDASRHLLTDIHLFVSRYNEAMEAIEAAAARAGASPAARVGAFNPIQPAPGLGTAAGPIVPRAAPAAEAFVSHPAPAAGASGWHALPAAYAGPSWEEEEEERQLRAALEASLREYQQMQERQQQLGGLEQPCVLDEPPGASHTAAGAPGDTPHALAAEVEAAGGQAEAWVQHSPQQQQQQQQEDPGQPPLPENPNGPPGGELPGREDEDEEQRQLAAVLEASVREQHLSPSQLEALERQQVEEALQASLQQIDPQRLPSALEVRLEHGGHASGADNGVIDLTYSQSEEGEVVLLSPSPLGLRSQQQQQQQQQAAKRQRVGVRG